MARVVVVVWGGDGVVVVVVGFGVVVVVVVLGVVVLEEYVSQMKQFSVPHGSVFH